MELYNKKETPRTSQRPRLNTNESITSLEDEASNRSFSDNLNQVQYNTVNNNLKIESHITDAGLYSYMVAKVEKDLEESLNEQQATEIDLEKLLEENKDLHLGSLEIKNKLNSLEAENATLKDQFNTLELKLKGSEQEKDKLASILKEQTDSFNKTKSVLEKVIKDSNKLELELEVSKQAYNSQLKVLSKLKTGLNFYKETCQMLQSENDKLRNEVRIGGEGNSGKELWNRLNEYSKELAKENEAQKIVIDKLSDKLELANKELDKMENLSKKYKGKIKELKKERDLLKIEILKVKQGYSDKCERYKEARNKLQKKLKEKDQELNYLQENSKSYHKNTRKEEVDLLRTLQKEETRKSSEVKTGTTNKVKW